MLYQIASFLLDVIGGLLTGACLLRWYMQWQRVPFSNPVGGLVFALTDWLVVPLRRVVAPAGRWDLSSLVAAVLLQLVQYLLLALLLGLGAAWAWVPGLAFFGLLRVAVSGLMGLLIVYAVLSGVQQGRTALADVMARYLLATLPDSYELEAALRHLLEAKDAAVRCMIAQMADDDPRNDGLIEEA